MKICFNARTYDKYWPELFLRVKAADSSAEAVFVTLNSDETATVKSIIPDAVVYQGDEYMKSGWDSFTEEKLCGYEKKYNAAPLWKYLYTDRFLIDEDYDYNVRTACGIFSFFEMIFEKESIDFFYDEVVATLFTYVPYIICKATGAEFVTQMIARGDDAGHHYIITDEFQHIHGFDNDYAAKDKQYSDEARLWSEKLLTAMETKGVVPEYMKINGRLPKLIPRNFLSPAMYLIRKNMPKWHNKYSYMNYRSYRSSFVKIERYTRYIKSKKYYEQPVPGEKYVLFPLHYQPEASTIVCAPKYEKQLYYIDNLAKSLPMGTKLYLKEHYAVLGHRELDFYKALKKYPNVRLITPFADTRKLILDSVAVTTMTGTAGWEAMLLRRPVILGGRIFFENAPGVTRTDDIFQNYISIMENYVQPSREEVLKYLCEYYSNLYPGCSNVLNTHFYEKENLDKLAASLLSFMHEKPENNK